MSCTDSTTDRVVALVLLQVMASICDPDVGNSNACTYMLKPKSRVVSWRSW